MKRQNTTSSSAERDESFSPTSAPYPKKIKSSPSQPSGSSNKQDKGEWTGEKKGVLMEQIFRSGVGHLDWSSLAAQVGQELVILERD